EGEPSPRIPKGAPRAECAGAIRLTRRHPGEIRGRGAARSRRRIGAEAEAARRRADAAAEDGVEVREGAPSRLARDLDHAHSRVAQQRLGALDPQRGHVLAEGHAELALEEARDVALRQARAAREGRQRDLVEGSALELVEGAAEALASLAAPA